MKPVLRNSRHRTGLRSLLKISNPLWLIFFMTSSVLVLEAGNSGFDAALVGGQPIPVGANDGVGPLPSIGISSTPLGFAYLEDEGRPAIFVSSDRWHPGFQLYKWIKDTPSGVPVFSPPIDVDVSGLAKLDDHILQDHAVASYIFQTPDGTVHGIWIRQDECAIALFDRDNTRFDVVSRVRLSGLPRLPRAATGYLGEDGKLVDRTHRYDERSGPTFAPRRGDRCQHRFGHVPCHAFRADDDFDRHRRTGAQPVRRYREIVGNHFLVCIHRIVGR